MTKVRENVGVIDAEQTLPADAEPTMRELFAMLLETRKADQQIQRDQLKQTKAKSNTRGPDISAFNPLGEKDHPMPALAFDVMAPWQMTKGKFHPLTREEVELMNRVQAPSEVTIELLDDTSVRCAIIAQKNIISGATERIAFMGPKDSEGGMYTSLFTKERKTLVPSMVKLLHQILDQQGVDYDDILTMRQINTRIALPVDDPKHLAVSVGE